MKVLKYLVRFFLVLLILIALALTGFVVRWAVNQKNAADFLPARTTLRLQSPSLGTLYSEWLNLEAADLVLSAGQMGGLRALLKDLRSSGSSSNGIIRGLLEVPFVLILKGEHFVANFDLGWRSLFTHFIPWLGGSIKLEGLSLISRDGFQYFRFESGDASLFLSLYENLALVSDDERLLTETLSRGQNPEENSGPDSRAMGIFRRSSSSIKILADTPALINSASSQNEGMKDILKLFQLPEESVVSVDITNENLVFEASTRLEAQTDIGAKILRFSAGRITQSGLIPDNVSLWTLINAARFEDVLFLVASTDPGMSSTLDSADSTSRTLIGAGLEELLYKWTSGEVGIFMLPTSSEPTLVLKIQDRGAFNRAFEYLEKSLFLRPSDEFLVDQIPIKRLALPGFLELVLGMFDMKLSLPYYLVEGDFLLLSTDSDNLIKVINAKVEGKTFEKNIELRRIWDKLPTDPKLLVYYDLTQQVPFFLRDQSLTSRLLRLYQRGVLGIYIRNNEVDLKLSAQRLRTGSVGNFPGFPKLAQGRITSQVYALPVEGGGSPVLAYIADGNRLIIDSILEESIKTDTAERIRFLVPQVGSRGVQWFWGAGNDGRVSRWSDKAVLSPGFPMELGSPLNVPPVLWGENLLVILEKEFKPASINPSGEIIVWDYVFSDPLVFPPVYRDRRWAFYPRSFMGEIAVLDDQGNLVNDEAIPVDGLGASEPVWVRALGDLRLYFLTVDGTLSAFTSDGKLAEGFPKSFPGVYQAPPMMIKTQGSLEILVLLSENGKVLLISPEGEILRETSIDGLGKDSRLASSDIQGSPLEEIFIYGGSDRLTVLDQNLLPVPGYPQRGHSRPSFLDLNGDRKPEVVTAGLDGQIYIYTYQQ